MSCETTLPQALSDHQTHDYGTLAQILDHTDPLEVVHSAPGHHMELYQSPQARWMGAAAAAGSAHSVNPAHTQKSLQSNLTSDKIQNK